MYGAVRLRPTKRRKGFTSWTLVVSHLYGLKEPQVVHIFETFHERWDCEDPAQMVCS